MWKRVLIIATLGVLALFVLARPRDPSPIASYLHPRDALASIVPIGVLNFYPCTRMTVHDGVQVYESKPVDQCFKMQPQRRFRGIWLDQFEGSTFFEGATDFRVVRTQIRQSATDRNVLEEWLDFAVENREAQPSPEARLVAVEFIGRRTAYPGRYGHMGVFQSEVLVDRMISVRPLYQSPFHYIECEFPESSVSCE